MIHKQTYWSTEYILANCLPLTENSQSKASLSCHSLHISTCSINGNKANLSLSLPFCSSLMFNFLCLFWTNLFFVEYVGLSHSTSARSSGLTLFTLSLFVTQAAASSVSERWACFFYFFGLIPNASVLLFFFGFIFIEWYLCVWCNTMKTYIINRLHHGFKEYCCFVYH